MLCCRCERSGHFHALDGLEKRHIFGFEVQAKLEQQQNEVQSQSASKIVMQYQQCTAEKKLWNHRPIPSFRTDRRTFF